MKSVSLIVQMNRATDISLHDKDSNVE